MPNLYYYNHHTNLSREELFLWIVADQTMEQLGGEDIAAALAVLSGQPLLPTRAKFGGSTPGTSVASVASRRLIRYRMPIALPTLTGASLGTLKLTFTRNLGAFIGRLIPGVGWTILAYDVVLIMQKSIVKYNVMAKDGDKLW